MAASADTKVCSKCGLEKPARDLSARVVNHDGLDAWCRVCHRMYGREWYANKRQYHLSRCRAYGSSAAGKATRRKARSKNIDKIRANAYMNNAIKDGRFARGTVCADCTAVGCMEGHHTDYNKPLDVVWLCTPCHRKRHRKP